MSENPNIIINQISYTSTPHKFIESTMIYVVSRPVRNRSEYDFHKPAYM